MAPAKQQRKRLLVPQVVQTSAMDCGPASLKAVLEGFGIPVSYGRLREACQTSVDGTSIDTLEDIAAQLGLQAEQIMLPADHLLMPEADALPAIVVVRLPNGLTHFVVVWSQHGNWVQVMNPGAGRQWITKKRFLDQVFVHHFPVPAQNWREWAGSRGFLDPLQQRMAALGVPRPDIDRLTDLALQDAGWRSLAALDAATRMVTSIVRAGGLDAGQDAASVLERMFVDNAGAPPAQDALTIPLIFWSASQPPDSMKTAEPGQEQLLLHGAVLVRIAGLREAQAGQAAPAAGEPAPAPLAPELLAALQEPPLDPEREILNVLRQDGLLAPGVLAAALGIEAVGLTIQALLLQGLLQAGQALNLLEQRLAAVAAMFVFFIALFFIEIPLTATTQRIGRRLETRLRIAFLEKLPRLSDRYFHSRLTSDMTQRAHALRGLRTLPTLGVMLLRLGFRLILTAAGVIWLQPHSAPLAILATGLFIGLSFAARPLLEERDLRLRSHLGALSRFYLDALLGLAPLRAHGAERAFRREHEGLLVEWTRASADFSQAMVALQAVSAVLYSGLAVWILFDFIARGGQAGSVLLLFYWTLSLPAMGQAFVETVQQYPMLRNSILRLLEPLGAPDETDAALDETDAAPDAGETTTAGVSIEMQNVSVQAGGHTILADINFSLEPGEHLAIVGPSGAGKTSLVGILLGWHTPAAGQCLVDGQPLDGSRLRKLRRCTAWVDPAVQLWNRSLLENLLYGNQARDLTSDGLLIEEADLFEVFERLENGLQTPLGESGGLVSGGEGQRVRLGRAMNRRGARLVILDEPFRGLDREKRRALLNKAREFWRGATLICVTHDVGETQAFERVLVIQDGQIVEDDAPAKLAAQPDSRYRAMLDAEQAVRKGLWESAGWRRLWIQDGQLTELPPRQESKRKPRASRRKQPTC